MDVLTVFRRALSCSGVELLFCSVGVVFRDLGSIPKFSFYVSCRLVSGAAWARCLEQVCSNYGLVPGPWTIRHNWMAMGGSQQGFQSSCLEGTWKEARRTLTVKHVI